MNDLWAARKAENKIEQLRTAAAIGFAIPKTVITNDPSDAQCLLDEGATVVKSLASGYFEFSGHAFVYTQELNTDLLADQNNWFAQPLIVQHRVEGTDVRVIVVGDQCFAAQCTSPGIDWRAVTPSPEWRECTPPSSVSQLCQRYVSDFGLTYAAFDFIDDGDRWWFLEANQAGEWAFLDRKLDLGIADTIAELLISLSLRPT